MRSSSSLLGRGLMGIALQARIFGAARVEWKHTYTMPSRDKNNLKVNLKQNLENNLQLESFSVSSVCSVDFLSSEFRRNLYGNKIFKKILTENALEYLAFGENFIMDRLTGSTS